MRRLFGLGVILSSGLIAACGSSSSPPSGTGGNGGAAGGGGKAGAAAGTTGQAGGGAGGQPSGGVGGQSLGGAGGQSLGGAGGQSLGGAGGQPAGGAGGQSAGGAGGHASAGAGGQTCLDPSGFSSLFAIADSTFCAVALYSAPESIGYQAPTWGSHGGPLVVQQGTGTSVTLERWSAPTGATGTMTVQTTQVASALPADTYLGSQAIDLPFFGWTAIAWSGPSPLITGQFEMIANGAVATSYTADGPYSAAGVSAPSSLGRFLFAALSPLGMPTANVNGLYAADACSSPAEALGTGDGCTASSLVAAWGESSGPVTTDSNGDVFAVLSSFTTSTQEARGFLASSVARGAAATPGVSLFTVAGYSGSLAALTPTATVPGLVVFQQIDSTTNDPVDVIEQKFTISSGLAAMGTPTKLLTVASGQTQGFSFLVDGSQHLWIAVPGTTSTTYVVLARQ
jgi:hypothetical protein